MHNQLSGEDRFSINQIARLLRKHSGTIWRWVLRGVRGHRLRSFHVGGRRYVTRKDLEAFLSAINATGKPDADSRGTQIAPHHKENGTGRAGHQQNVSDVNNELDREGL